MTLLRETGMVGSRGKVAVAMRWQTVRGLAGSDSRASAGGLRQRQMPRLVIHLLPGRYRIDSGLLRMQERVACLDDRVAVLTKVGIGGTGQVVQAEMGEDSACRHDVRNGCHDPSLSATERTTQNVDAPYPGQQSRPCQSESLS